MAKSNEKKFEFHPSKPFSDDSFVPPVIFHDSEAALSLDRSIHSKKGSVNTFQVVQNLLMK